MTNDVEQLSKYLKAVSSFKPLTQWPFCYQNYLLCKLWTLGDWLWCVSLGSSIVTNVPLWPCGEGFDNGRGYACVEARGILEISVILNFAVNPKFP